MKRRTLSILVVGVWAAPLVLGVAIAMWVAIKARPAGPAPGAIVVQPDPPSREELAQWDSATLQGVWLGTSVECDGRVVHRGEEAKKAKVKFEGDGVVFENDGNVLRGTFRLDPIATPRAFDLTIKEGNTAETYPAGIYRLERDEFRLCFAYPSRQRPTEFATAPGSGRTLFVYRRGGPAHRAEHSWRGVDDEAVTWFPSRPTLSLGPVAIGLGTTLVAAGAFIKPYRYAPGGTMKRQYALPLAAALLIGMSPPSVLEKKTWDFESDEPGKIAKGFTGEVGTWEVAKDGDNRVLYQKARNDDAVFNVALVEGTSYKDLELSVKLKAVAGANDRGGGVVWRAKDAKNYYIARYNPLEDNFRVYKVENGKRTQFADAKTPGDEMWHTLRVTMAGSKITCYLDGKKHLEAEDATFPEAGKVGLWSKADAQSYFDDLTASEVPAR